MNKDGISEAFELLLEEIQMDKLCPLVQRKACRKGINL